MNMRLEGTTLIEVLIYVALWSILLTSLMSGEYALLLFATKKNTDAGLIQEGLFVLDNAQAQINANIENPTLVADSGYVLNQVSIEKYALAAYILVSFTLSARDEHGQIHSQDFSRPIPLPL